MFTIYFIGIFLFSSSSVMVGYVWVRDIINTRAQAASLLNGENRDLEEIETSEEILADYPLMKRTA